MTAYTALVIDRRAPAFLGPALLVLTAVVFVAGTVGALDEPAGRMRWLVLIVSLVICTACALLAAGLIRFFMTVRFDGRDLIVTHRHLFRTTVRHIPKTAYRGVEWSVRKVRLQSGGRRSRWVDYHAIRLVPHDTAPEIELEVTDNRAEARIRWERWANRFGLPALVAASTALAQQANAL